MKKKVIIALSLPVLLYFLPACASQTVNNGFTSAGYEAFEVVPVSNETGKRFAFDVAAEMTKQIISRLRQEGLNVADNSENILIIRSSLTSYGTAVAGAATCTVKSILIDGRTRKVLDEIVTSGAMSSAGGLSELGLKANRAVLEMVADDIVTQIEKRIGRKK